MKIKDIILEREITIESQIDKQIRLELNKKGYRYLGAGVDQQAYLEPKTGYVLKVFGSAVHNASKFSDSHKMFFAWAKFCMANQDNPFLPKFYGYESFVWKFDMYLQIRQERLYKSKFSAYVIEDIAEYISDHEGFGGFKWGKKTPCSANQFIKDIDNQWDQNDVNTLIKKLGGMPQFTKLFNTIKTLYQIGEKKEWGWDLHAGNILDRKDGTPVLVDPWHLGTYYLT
jgi:hypothetical protein